MKKLLLVILPLFAVTLGAMDNPYNPYKRKHNEFFEQDLLTAVRLADANGVRELVKRVSRSELRVALDLAIQQLQAAQNDIAREQKLRRIVELLEFYLDT